MDFLRAQLPCRQEVNCRIEYILAAGDRHDEDRLLFIDLPLCMVVDVHV